MSQTRRVLSAQIAHETNTFSIVPTTIEDYRKRLLLLDAEIAAALTDTRMEIAAHLAAAKRYGWTLVQPVAAAATPSGKVTVECWAELQRLIYEACETGPLDAIILALHGAMVTETDDDAEGALLEGLRKRLGETIPIAVTLDLHANVTERMGRLANIMLPYRTYPHIDQYETAFRAAELLQSAMDGTIRPKVFRLQGPLLEGCNHGRTQGGVMSDLLARAADMQAQTPGLLSVDVCAGFSLADIAEVGPSVQVTYDASHNAAEAAARQAAAALNDEMYHRRAEATVAVLDLPTATTLAVAAAADVADTRPLVIADCSDNPGSGAYGDGVRLLEALLQAEVGSVLFGVLGDPETAARCHAAGLGASLDVVVGAKRHPASYGPPLKLTGRVTGLSDGAFVCEGPMNAGQPMSLGPAALLEVNGISIAISTNTLQTYDQEMFRILGAEPAQFRIVAVKSAHHFRAAFGPMAKEVILADSGGLATNDHTKLSYRRVRRPIWPLDEIMPG
ncbi:M81 family metallopeptidase [Bradyrhizobium sp. USDA 329]|uniref:M81 family metallopeptidase n=1 Tax=unclassified Bradyrhizobium TaxID=2631580 RepID=UPI003517DA1E